MYSAPRDYEELLELHEQIILDERDENFLLVRYELTVELLTFITSQFRTHGLAIRGSMWYLVMVGSTPIDPPTKYDLPGKILQTIWERLYQAGTLPDLEQFKIELFAAYRQATHLNTTRVVP